MQNKVCVGSRRIQVFITPALKPAFKKVYTQRGPHQDTELSQSRCPESVWACLPRSLYSVPALHDHSPAEFTPQVNAHVQLLLGDLEWATRCWESILHRLLITNYALSSPMQPGLSLVPRLKPIRIHNPVY